MGYEYYLVREDNKTAFELGKSRGGLQRVFLDDFPKRFTIHDICKETLAELLIEAAKSGAWQEINNEYFHNVVDKITEWAEDSEIMCIGESDATIMYKENYEKAKKYRLWDDGCIDYIITNGRYDEKYYI